MLRLLSPGKVFLCYFALSVLCFNYLVNLEFIANPAVNLSRILAPPSLDHWLGTDAIGRDLGGRILKAVLEGTLILWVLSFLATRLGWAMGAFSLTSGFSKSFMKRGLRSFILWLDALPSILLVLIFVLLTGQMDGSSLGFGIFMLFFCKSFCLVDRLYQISENKGYWEAHKALGGTLADRILNYGFKSHWRESLQKQSYQNLQSSLIVECGFSYVGMGMSEPRASLGNILSSHFDDILRGDYWIAFVILTCFLILYHLPAKLADLSDWVLKKDLGAFFRQAFALRKLFSK